MLSHLFNRKHRRSLLLEINPHQLLVAGIYRPDSGPAIVQCAAEFGRDDDVGLRGWLEANAFKQNSWTPVVCGYVSSKGLLQRETVQPRELVDPDYLPNLVREEFKIENPEAWTFKIFSPLEGTSLPAEGSAVPGLISGISHQEVRRVQQRLLDHRMTPVRVENGLLPLFGSVFNHMGGLGEKRAALVVIIEEEQTTAFILGKEGVHTYSPVRHGYRSILHAARVELGLPKDADARALLLKPTDDIRRRAPKFMRAIGRDLKHLVNSYEMSTGQPAGGIFCAYMPPELAWIAEPLAKAMECPAIEIDCKQWMRSARLEVDLGIPDFGQHWLGALSLAVGFPGPKPQEAFLGNDRTAGPWHTDSKISAELPNNQLIGRRFLSGAIAASIAALALTVTVWQLYVISSVKADTDFWESEMARNQKLVDELTRTTREIQAGSTRLDYAYDLMASPLQVSDLILNLGRTLPPNMRVDRIESSLSRIALSGGLHEPSEVAGGTLNRYLEELRRTPGIGSLFSSIGVTALQREADTDMNAFEITFRLKASQP